MENIGTLYDVVLRNGQELQCYSKGDFRQILQTFHNNINEVGLFVRENTETKKVTFIFSKEISHLRFPEDGDLVQVDI